jgi:hypothetical protein
MASDLAIMREEGRRDAAGCRIPQGATGTKVGSMAWKISGIWVPCHGKTAQFGFHGVEKRRIRVPWRGSPRVGADDCRGRGENDDSPCGGREGGQILGGWSNFERRRRVR